MDSGTDAELRRLRFSAAVRAGLVLYTCPLSFWTIVRRLDDEGAMIPAILAPQILLSPVARWAALAALVAAVWGHGWLKGVAHEERQAEALRGRQEAATLAHAAELARRADEITLVYITQTRTVRERGATIVREVPRYVTPADNRACPVPAGFVSLLNAAARNELPEPAGRPHDAPAGPAARP